MRWGRHTAPNEGGMRFIALPQTLAELAEVVYTAAEIKLNTDYVVVKLREKPSTFPSKPLGWPVGVEDKHLHQPVYGWATSGHMGGTNLVKDTERGVLAFIQERGEPGQSGTLVFNTVDDQPLGVYYGVRNPEASAHSFRGRIVSVPPVSTPTPGVIAHEVIKMLPKEVNYETGNSSWKVAPLDHSAQAAAIKDGEEEFTGVFVEYGKNKEALDFTGSAVQGACLCAPLKKGVAK